MESLGYPEKQGVRTPQAGVECNSSLSFVSLLKYVSIELVMLSNHLILWHSLLLLPSIFPSVRVFGNESFLCIRWPKDWSFSFSNNSSNEYSGLIFFRIGWFDLLVSQRTLNSHIQHQFESISSLVLSLLHGPTLTSIYDYKKKTLF